MSWAVGDATDATSVREVLAGAEVAYYLVHSLGSRDFELDSSGREDDGARGRGRGLRQLIISEASGKMATSSRRA